MQPDSKTNFINSNIRNNNQVTLLLNVQYLKKILSHCEKYLNSYIKFLVPPQESYCGDLKRIFCEATPQSPTTPNDATLCLVVSDNETNTTNIEGDPSNEETFKMRTPTSFFNSSKASTPGTPTPKVCRFAIVDEVKPFVPSPAPFSIPKPATPKVTRFVEVAEVVPIHEQQALIIEEPIVDSAVKVQKVKPFTGFKSLEKDVVDGFQFPSPLGSKPKPAFAAIPISSTLTLDEKLGTPLTPTTPRFPESPNKPRYTTQVSAISQKSNTVSLYSCWPPPISIILISIIEVIFFFVNEREPTPGRLSHGNIADKLMYNPYRRKEAWRYVTYLFVHIGLQHLLFNLGIQIFLGIILEMVHQRWRVLTIYFAGVLAGSLGTSVVNPRVKLAGASGGVYSLLTAHIVTVLLKWKDMQYPATQLLGFMIIFITDFASGIYSFRSNRVEDIGYTAHFCGALAGLLVGFPILRKLSEEKRTRWVQYVGLVVYLLLIISAIMWNIFATEYFPKQEI